MTDWVEEANAKTKVARRKSLAKGNTVARRDRSVRTVIAQMRKVMDRTSRSPATRGLARRIKNAAQRVEGRCRHSREYGVIVRTGDWAKLREEAVQQAMVMDLNAARPPGELMDMTCDILLLLMLADSIRSSTRHDP